MLDEIIPALKPSKRLKMLAAEPELTGVLPEVNSHISFLPLINYLKEKRSSIAGIKQQFYNYLIKKFEADPVLVGTIDEVTILEDHADLLELLGTTLFPVVSKHEKVTYALGAPYKFQVFYYSDCFRQIFMDTDEAHLLLPAGMTPEQLKEIECSMVYDHVLEKFYGVKLNDSPELIYPVADLETGLKKYYKIRYDRRFIDVHLKGELPPLKDCAVCMNSFRILDLEKQLQTMPLNLFEVEGFAVWVAEDVTKIEALESIKKILLNQSDFSSNSIQELKAAVQVLVGLNDVDIGLMPFIKINNKLILEEEFTRQSIIGKQWHADDPKDMELFEMFMGFIQGHPGPVPLSVVNKELAEMAPFMKQLYENGARSFIAYPMQNSDGFLGLLEIASPIPNVLTHEIISRIEPAVPLLSVALLKHRDGFYTKVEKHIKEKFTALQPSVEWKFAEVAWNQLRANGNATTANVVFDDVYPLYGAVDIRNSSLQRSRAIQKDMKAHLQLLDGMLDELQISISLPLLEGLKFKNQHLQQSIEEIMSAEDEVRINDFIENEVQPVFNHLHKSNSAVQEIVDRYLNKVKDSNSALYHYRGEYEDTLATINNSVLHYLEQEEEKVQRSYPHYFERYRSDGIEYNIYIGQSIAPDYPFDLLYLKNIRLWQLQSMAEIASRTHQLLPSLKVPLETTQLILVYSKCISISFRNDERRFDVEGSYNVRYETIKKRLDKACIKGSGERLTQPGMIAIVYSNQKEAQEYLEYIHFLQNKGIVQQEVEKLELEELQGIQGLKALRVKINMQE